MSTALQCVLKALDTLVFGKTKEIQVTGGNDRKKKTKSMHKCNLAAGKIHKLQIAAVCFKALSFARLSASFPLAAFSGSPALI